MSLRPRWIYTPTAVRELDRMAIEEQGIPGYVLMERAAEASLNAIRDRYPEHRRWLIVCGGGNNGGDGLVLARLARAEGLAVAVRMLLPHERLAGDAARAWQDAEAAGVDSRPWSDAQDNGGFDLVVDALLGTGLQRPLEADWLQCVQWLNALACPRVSLDLPSGLDGLSGAVLGAAVRADLTVTFVGLKQGLFCGHGPEYAGEIALDDLGIAPVEPARVAPVLACADDEVLLPFRQMRPREAHKGHFGHVLVIGGNEGTAGAARLAAESALRSGAGLVTVATRPASVPVVMAGRPELMCRGVQSVEDLDLLLERATHVVIGPGLGTDAWAQSLWLRASASDRPLVVDADALNLLALQPWRGNHWVLTPHPGEAARLLGLSSAAVQADRPAAAQALVARYGGVAVLKGAGTLVAAAGAIPWLITEGNPGMATAGCGDVLAGLVAGLWAQQPTLPPASVAAAAALAHARAGDRAAAAGQRGMLASDLLQELRRVLN